MRRGERDKAIDDCIERIRTEMDAHAKSGKPLREYMAMKNCITAIERMAGRASEPQHRPPAEYWMTDIEWREAHPAIISPSKIPSQP